mgnify:CR=1 FL=1
MDKLKIDKKGYVTFCAAAEYNGKLYIADSNSRGLLEYDLTTKKTIIKNVFMAENYMKNYWSAFTYKNEIWFVPVRDYQQIAIYNVNKNTITYLSYPKSEQECAYIPFMDYHIVKNNIYLIPAHYDCILKINPETKDVSRISIGVDDFAGDGYPVTMASVVTKDKIIMCPYNNKKMFIFDTNTDQITECVRLEYVKTYSNIGIYNDTVILIPDDLNNDICEVDLRKKSHKYKTILCRDEYKKLKYPAIIVDDNDIYFFPDNGNGFLKYDYLNEKMMYKEIYIPDRARKLKYIKGRKLKESLFIVLSDDSKTPCMLISNGCIETVELKLPEDFFIRELLMQIKGREIYDIRNSSNI